MQVPIPAPGAKRPSTGASLRTCSSLGSSLNPSRGKGKPSGLGSWEEVERGPSPARFALGVEEWVEEPVEGGGPCAPDPALGPRSRPPPWDSSLLHQTAGGGGGTGGGGEAEAEWADTGAWNSQESPPATQRPLLPWASPSQLELGRTRSPGGAHTNLAPPPRAACPCQAASVAARCPLCLALGSDLTSPHSHQRKPRGRPCPAPASEPWAGIPVPWAHHPAGCASRAPSMQKVLTFEDSGTVAGAWVMAAIRGKETGPEDRHHRATLPAPFSVLRCSTRMLRASEGRRCPGWESEQAHTHGCVDVHRCDTHVCPVCVYVFTGVHV